MVTSWFAHRTSWNAPQSLSSNEAQVGTLTVDCVVVVRQARFPGHSSVVVVVVAVVVAVVIVVVVVLVRQFVNKK